VIAGLLVCLGSGAAAAEGRTQAPIIHVLSNRADLISGGDALVAIDLPPRASPSRVRVYLNGHYIQRDFAMRPNGRYEGLVRGLHKGVNVLYARLPNGTTQRIRITNHPNGGPVFQGPQLQPWICQTTAVDAQCNQPPEYSYVYKSTDDSKKGLQPYDPENPPSDVATTTSQSGTEMPFIVRIETGYQDRDQYKIATLFQPGQQWEPWDPQQQWNHKLLITHGASCGTDFGAYTAPSVIDYDPAGDLAGFPVDLPATANSAEYALGRGFAVMSTDLDNNGDNCNLVLQAESLVMAKERLVEQYGELRYTIGTGCSGGSLTQQWVANAYPGIYQGILPTCSFPDTWTSATQVFDFHLLRLYLEDSSKWGTGIAWTPQQMAQVEGGATHLNAYLSDTGFFGAAVPSQGCWPLAAEVRYDPNTNPDGVRCGIADAAINVFGPRPESAWGPQEQQLGHGFAGLAIDNVGVQYGLDALKQAQITPAQFVDLNQKIGGTDIDTTPTAARLQGDDQALSNAYRSGMINETNNLDQTAIIDCRGPDPGAAHDSYRAFAVRARLDREHGTHANQLIWEGPTPLIGDTKCSQSSLDAMDQWLTAVENDTRDEPVAQKLVDDKPASIGDECWDGSGNKLIDGLCPPGVVPVYGTPRTVAGDALTTDTNKCQLRPLNRSDADYGPVPFTDGQWAQLQALFPNGVCDYSKAAVGRQATTPWQTYQDRAGNVIYGGVPMGPPPVSR
jgi:hypothetical protein